MGRKTWDSLPEKFRPLPQRINYVLSAREGASFPGAFGCSSFEEVIEDFTGKGAAVDTLWAIGGHSIYKMALSSPHLHRVYMTRIHASVPCDTFMPPLPPTLVKVTDPDVSDEVQEEEGMKYHYDILENVSPSS